MSYVFFALLPGLLLPILASLRPVSVWQGLVVFATVTTKTSVFALFYATIIKQDEMAAFTAAIAISVGNAGLMLLAYVFSRLNIE